MHVGFIVDDVMPAWLIVPSRFIVSLAVIFSGHVTRDSDGNAIVMSVSSFVNNYSSVFVLGECNPIPAIDYSEKYPTS